MTACDSKTEQQILAPLPQQRHLERRVRCASIVMILKNMDMMVSAPQCKHIIKYGVSRRGQQHSARCRKRLVEAMSKTESGRLRIANNDERINRSMAEQV